MPRPWKVTSVKTRNMYTAITDGCGDGSNLQVQSEEESRGTAEKFELRVLFDPLGWGNDESATDSLHPSGRGRSWMVYDRKMNGMTADDKKKKEMAEM